MVTAPFNSLSDAAAVVAAPLSKLPDARAFAQPDAVAAVTAPLFSLSDAGFSDTLYGLGLDTNAAVADQLAGTLRMRCCNAHSNAVFLFERPLQ